VLLQRQWLPVCGRLLRSTQASPARAPASNAVVILVSASCSTAAFSISSFDFLPVDTQHRCTGYTACELRTPDGKKGIRQTYSAWHEACAGMSKLHQEDQNAVTQEPGLHIWLYSTCIGATQSNMTCQPSSASASASDFVLSLAANRLRHTQCTARASIRQAMQRYSLCWQSHGCCVTQ
jgi:hypothetical protein